MNLNLYVKNIYMKKYNHFLLIFIFYVLLILIIPPKNSVGDEARYIRYSTNIIHGFYADEAGVVNPPAYPMVLLPFIYLKMHLIFAKILNAFFLIFAIIFFYRTLNNYIDRKISLFFSYLLGLFPGVLIFITELHTEIFSIFLICGFMYYYILIYQNNDNYLKKVFLSSIFLLALILTKAIFGYVILVIIVLLVLRKLIFKKKDINFSVFIFTFILCIPYLSYTYLLTGKILYWASNGGDTLYWMSTPYPDEYGDWFSYKSVESSKELKKNHQSIYDSAYSLSPFKRDQFLRKKAIENIENHPSKYLMNWLANIGRLFFNYPFSYLTERTTTYFYIVPNMFIVVFMTCGLILSFLRWKNIPVEIKAILLFSAIYIGGMSLLSAVNRYILVILPPILFWLAFVFNRVLDIKLVGKK